MRFGRPIPFLLFAATLALGTAASAQFEGPGAGTADTSIQPPVLPQASDDGLIRLRGDQPVTTNALIGFVNSEPIFALDLIRPIDDDLRRFSRTSRTLMDFRDRATKAIGAQLAKREEDILILAAAKSALSDQDEQNIDQILAKYRSQLLAKKGGSVAIAEKDLRATGSSVEKEMADARREVTKTMYIRKFLMPKIVVTGKMVADAYEANAAKWKEEAHLELFTITLPVYRWLPTKPTTDGTTGDPIDHPTDAQVKQAETDALGVGKEVVAKLKAGGDFARLAEDYKSQDYAVHKGGRTPNVTRGDLPLKAFENYVFSLPANTIGDPQLIHDPDPMLSRVIVVKVGERTGDRTISFMEAQPDIVNELRQKQMIDLENELRTKLESTSATEALDRNLYLAVDVAVSLYATK